MASRMRVTSFMDEARCYEALPITAKTIGHRTQDSMWHSAARLLVQPNLALIRKVLFAIRAESGGNCVEHGKLKTARRTVCAESASRSEISRGVGAGSPLASLSRTNSNTRRWIWVIHSCPAKWLVLPPEFVNSAFAQEFT